MTCSTVHVLALTVDLSLFLMGEPTLGLLEHGRQLLILAAELSDLGLLRSLRGQ